VQALIVQNAVAHAEGLSDGFVPARAYWANRSAETEKPMRDLLTLKTTRFQYLHGASRPERINPDSWTLHQALLDRPGNVDIVAGGQAYRRDVPKAEVHLFDGGHFLLEEHAEAVATLIRKFLGAQRNAQRR
jgi:hypothetical protein